MKPKFPENKKIIFCSFYLSIHRAYISVVDGEIKRAQAKAVPEAVLRFQ